MPANDFGSTTDSLTISGNVVYPSQTWLDSSAVTVGGNWCDSVYYTPSYSWGYVGLSKIRLKLSEVERMRLAAKEDKKLKEIFRKLAPHIEIEVDFE